MYSTCTCTVLFTGHYRIYKLTCRKSVEVSEAVCGTFIGTPTVQYLWACVTRLPRCFKPIGVSASLRRAPSGFESRLRCVSSAPAVQSPMRLSGAGSWVTVKYPHMGNKCLRQQDTPTGTNTSRHLWTPGSGRVQMPSEERDPQAAAEVAERGGDYVGLAREGGRSHRGTAQESTRASPNRIPTRVWSSPSLSNLESKASQINAQ